MSQYDLFETKQKRDAVGSGAYRFIQKLGEGSYATVFLAEFFHVSYWKEPLQKVACKVIDTLKIPKDYNTKFLPRELDILRKFNHPHIIQVYAIYQKSTKYLIFMRFAEKGDLLAFINKSGGIMESQARIWVKQMGLAIQYLHELEVAHRDLKCENILLTANFNVKLSDFGFARLVLNKRGVRVLSATYCGSLSYSAPEILKGMPYNPKISDMWALGVIIFEMMNNTLPFESFQVKKLYQQQINRKWKFRSNIDASRQVALNATTPESGLRKVWCYVNVKELIDNLLEPNTDIRYTVTDLLNSEWLFMDHRLLGMNEEETLALIKAKDERKKMEEFFLSSKNKMMTRLNKTKNAIQNSNNDIYLGRKN